MPNKFKNHEVTAVGWNFSNDSDSTTGPILLGTSKGLIFETEIAFDGDRMFQSGLEQYWKQVCIIINSLFKLRLLYYFVVSTGYFVTNFIKINGNSYSYSSVVSSQQLANKSNVEFSILYLRNQVKHISHCGILFQAIIPTQ